MLMELNLIWEMTRVLKHSFIDTTVQNGQTYYYAVVAYDQGFTNVDVKGNFEGIPPSETTSILKKILTEI